MESLLFDLHKLYPELSLKMRQASSTNCAEAFELAIAAHSAVIESGSLLGKNYALSQLIVGLKSGYLGNFIGLNCPLFQLRPLWLAAENWYILPQGIKLALPNWVLDESLLFDSIKQVIELGYNTLLFASLHLVSQPQALSLDVLKKHLDLIRQSGLKIALRIAPESLDFAARQFQGNIDYLFVVEGDIVCSGPPESTPFEQAICELTYLNEQLSIPVIYHAQKTNVVALSRMVRTDSLISFTQTAHEALHPLFLELLQVSSIDKTRIVTLLEVSQCDLPNGQLFSDIPLAFIENVLGWQRNDRFYGAGCVCRRLAPLACLSQLPVWVIGQRMWRAVSVHALIESWFCAFQPEWQKLLDFALIHRLFYLLRAQDVEGACRELSYFALAIGQAREWLRFQKQGANLRELSDLLYQFQLIYKQSIEQLCQQKGVKQPLILQNFVPKQLLLYSKN